MKDLPDETDRQKKYKGETSSREGERTGTRFSSAFCCLFLDPFEYPEILWDATVSYNSHFFANDGLNYFL